MLENRRCNQPYVDFAESPMRMTLWQLFGPVIKNRKSMCTTLDAFHTRLGLQQSFLPKFVRHFATHQVRLRDILIILDIRLRCRHINGHWVNFWNHILFRYSCLLATWKPFHEVQLQQSKAQPFQGHGPRSAGSSSMGPESTSASLRNGHWA